jgi:hypothetical protein
MSGSGVDEVLFQAIRLGKRRLDPMGLDLALQHSSGGVAA